MTSSIGRTMAILLSTLAISTALAQQSGGSGQSGGATNGAAQSGGTPPAYNPNSNPNPNPTSSPIQNPNTSPAPNPAGPTAVNPAGPLATNPAGMPATNTSQATAQTPNAATANAIQVFTTLDPGHKGYLSGADVASNKFLATNFQRCDTNGDARLTQAETTLCLQSAPPGQQ